MLFAIGLILMFASLIVLFIKTRHFPESFLYIFTYVVVVPVLAPQKWKGLGLVSLLFYLGFVIMVVGTYQNGK